MNLRWTSDALDDRRAIWDHIVKESPSGAARMDQIFSDFAEKLLDFPYLGRAGRLAGTREVLPHASYRLIYEIDAKTIWVLALVHTARQWPSIGK